MLVTNGDLHWLLTHVPVHDTPNLHNERVRDLTILIDELIYAERLPFTIGLFGDWGSGKTTFLAILAKAFMDTN
jgi:tRNA A37 threonylcarbamoyladenosine biosynthesis protein TsaE